MRAHEGVSPNWLWLARQGQLPLLSTSAIRGRLMRLDAACSGLAQATWLGFNRLGKASPCPMEALGASIVHARLAATSTALSRRFA